MFSGGYPFYRFKKQHVQSGCSLTFWWEIVLEGPLMWDSSYAKGECYDIWVVHLSLHKVKC